MTMSQSGFLSSMNPLPSWWPAISWYPWIIGVLAFLLYANTLGHDYTQDDAIVIYDNEYTTQGIAGIPDILKHDTFRGFFKVEGKDKLVSGGRYRPFTLILFALEWELFRQPKRDEQGTVLKDTEGNTLYQATLVGHLFNILWYAFCCVLLYRLLYTWTEPSLGKHSAALLAFVSALLFTAHPIHTEVVANIKGRDEIICLIGSLAAAYLAWKAWKNNWNLGWIFLGFVFFLGLMSKENAITFLAIIPIAHYVFGGASVAKSLQPVLPLGIATAVFLAIRSSIIGGSFGAPVMELMNNPFLKLNGSSYISLSFFEKLPTVLYTLWEYIRLLFIPHPLTHDYYPRHIPLVEWGHPKVWLSLISYLGLGVTMVIMLLRRQKLGFAIAAYLIPLSLVSNLVFSIGTNMAERLLFMPSVGWALAMGLVLCFGAHAWKGSNSSLTAIKRSSNGKKETKKKTASRPTAAFLPGLVLSTVLILAFAAKTVDRNKAWKNNKTLFLTDVETSVNSAKLQNAVGSELSIEASSLEEGPARTKLLRKAENHLLKAISVHPGYRDAVLQLGNTYNYLKEYDKAVQRYDQVLQMAPDFEKAHLNKQITLREAGRYYGEVKGDLGNSLKYLNQAVTLDPDDYETHRLLGTAYGISGRSDLALKHFKEALRILPKNADAIWNVGNAYFYAGDTEKANEYHQRAAQLDPEIITRRSGK